MGSSRLPGKILKPLVGIPALLHVITRLRHSKNLDEIVVATTEEPEDNPVEEFCTRNAIRSFRGSEKDVLDRYYRAAIAFKADPIVRITADCPVIDPNIVDKVVAEFKQGGYDIYGLSGEFPDGLDCTVFSFQTLKTAWKEAKLVSEREHVCPYMEKHPELFKIGGYKPFKKLQDHRWTLDEPDDYRFLTEIYSRLYHPEKIFLTEDILALLRQEPDLIKINQNIVRNEGYLKSLEQDKKSG